MRREMKMKRLLIQLHRQQKPSKTIRIKMKLRGRSKINNQLVTPKGRSKLQPARKQLSSTATATKAKLASWCEEMMRETGAVIRHRTCGI